MATFKAKALVSAPLADIVSAALGNGTTEVWTSEDVGKAVKLIGDSTYGVCSTGNEIEGFVTSVELTTVNSGVNFGGVQLNKRVEVTVGSDQGGTAMAVGDLVVAADTVTLGTNEKGKVKTGTAASQAGSTPFAYTERTPNTYLWRCISISSGTGVAGDTVVIERI